MKKIYFQIGLMLGVYLSAGAQEWEWQNPFPAGNSHSDVAWIGDDTLYIGGSKGQFITSTDFGQTWQSKNIPTQGIINETHFINSNTGWAVTSTGEIWHTEDAGNNWLLQFTDVQGATLRDIHFFNESIGYAAGDAGFAENFLFRTADGGNTWVGANLPMKESASFYGVFMVKAVDENTVYASSWDNTFFKSVDRGATWDTLHLPVSSGGFYEGGYFVNDSVGYLVGPKAAIIKTIDGGENWTALAGDADSTVQDQHYFSEVFFLDNNQGWVSSFGCLYKTNDGGSTWERSCEGTYGTGRKSFIAFNQSNKGIAVSGSQVYTTSDGVAFDLVLPTSPVNNLYKISHTDGGYFLAASGGKVFHSVNEGTDWTIINTPVTSILRTVKFLDASNGWVAGNDSTILNTTDGGLNWTAFDVDYSGNFNDLYAWSASSAIVVGNSGAIFKTTDGGSSWTKGTLASESHINSIYFANADTGYVVGRSGLLAQTVDGGDTWSLQDPGILSHLNDSYFLDAKTGYAVGSSGKILFTEDAGETWTEQVSGESGTLNAVFFWDKNHGYVTTSGRVLVTDDGGQSWSSQNTPSAVGLLDVYFNEEGKGWAVGGNGNILFYDGLLTGIDDIYATAEKSLVSAFPNPARANTTLALNNQYSGAAQLFIYNNTGKLVLTYPIMFQGGTAEWNIEPSISAGLYSYQVMIPEGNQSGKLMIQK